MRTGPIPKWPLPGKAPAAWADLWRLPQAQAWEELHLTRVVARYTAKLVIAEDDDCGPSILSEVRQLEDRLGLSAMSMLRLRWAIGGTEESASDGGAQVATMNDYRRAAGG